MTLLAAATATVAACGGGSEFQAGSGDAAGTGGSASGAGGSSAGPGGSASTGGAGAGGAAAGSSATGGKSGSSGSGASAGSGASGSSGSSGSSAAGGQSAGAGGASGATAGGSSGSSGHAGASGGAGQAGQAGAAGGGGAPVCDPTETANEMLGTFVAPAPLGDDTKGDGTRKKPYASIKAALPTLAATSRPHVYVAAGTYDASLTLPDVAGLVIEGGWLPGTASWTRDCSDSAGKQVIVTSSMAASNEPVVMIDSLTHMPILALFQIETRAAGATGAMDHPGDTVLGMLVRGAATKVKLEHVAIVVGTGGAAGPSSGGTMGSVSACDGLMDCSQGQQGNDASDGTPAAAGTWSDMGYQPGDGEPGMPGGDGQNGTVGQPGETGQCITCNSSMSSNCTLSGYTVTSTQAGTGTCGCGATHGSPGVAGEGGGASAGILIGQGAEVSGSFVSITTANGGDGSPGGTPGEPGTPSMGAMGAEVPECATKKGTVLCSWNGDSNTCDPTGVSVAPVVGGATGGNGGPAGKSGKGGGGSGGPSFDVVTLVDGKFTPDAATMLVPGKGGSGADGAPDGDAKTLQTFP